MEVKDEKGYRPPHGRWRVEPPLRCGTPTDAAVASHCNTLSLPLKFITHLAKLKPTHTHTHTHQSESTSAHASDNQKNAFVCRGVHAASLNPSAHSPAQATWPPSMFAEVRERWPLPSSIVHVDAAASARRARVTCAPLPLTCPPLFHALFPSPIMPYRSKKNNKNDPPSSFSPSRSLCTPPSRACSRFPSVFPPTHPRSRKEAVGCIIHQKSNAAAPSSSA